MIYVFTALYCEAYPIIKYLGLKRRQDINRFQLFSDDRVSLLITGTGSLNAAIGVTSLFSLFSPGSGDILLNTGICGTDNMNLKKGTPVLCNKIIDLATFKSVYPDMLYRHPFAEGTVLTSPVPVTAGTEKRYNGPGITVTDMEAYGIFCAGSIFLQPHQMFFIKTVSDYESGEQLNGMQVSELLSANVDKIFGWIMPIHDELSKRRVSVFSDEEKTLLEKAAEAMKITVSMRHQLNQMMRYHKLLHGGFTAELTNFLEDRLKKPCKTKNEGKKCFEELRKRFV